MQRFSLLFLVALLPACGSKEPAVDIDGDGSTASEDCNDADPSIHPGADEVCDGVDANCDGVFDDDLKSVFYMDVDEDGFGDPEGGALACALPPGFVTDATDCDDLDAVVFPGATEVCDGADDDCDGAVDEDVALTWYADRDGDGWGDLSTATLMCEEPVGMVTVSGDCDDDDASAFPGNIESCNRADDDCDGAVDEVFDLDLDGYLAGDACALLGDLDCDDADATVHPGAEEICDDGMDQNCEGSDGDCAFADAIDLGDAAGRVLGNGESAWAGRALDVGDVDGDGDADLLVGEMGYDGMTGAAGLTFGPITGDHAVGDGALVAGAEVGQGAGRDVALGDTDGDGRADLLIGAPYDITEMTGGAFLVQGPVTGALTVEAGAAFLLAAGTNELLGHAVDIGDLNDDGLGDLVVGAYQETVLSGGGGAAFVWEGPTDGTRLSTEADGWILGPGNPGYTGHIVLAGPDLTRDGIGDLCVTAIGSTGMAPPFAGIVFVAEGPVRGAMDAIDAWGSFTGEAGYDYAGQGLGAGDIDGDGTDDLFIGAPNATDGAGTVYGILAPTGGNALLSEAPLQIPGGLPERNGGDAIVVQDLDGDGVADLLLGAPGDDVGGANAGAACVFFGPLGAGTLSLGSADVALTGQDAGDGAGDALGAGDLDSDGVSELLIGAAYDSSGGGAAGAVFAVRLME